MPAAAAVTFQPAADGGIVRQNSARTAGAIYPTVNLGPLTTTFTPPNSCSSLTLAYVGHIRGQTDVFQFDYGRTCNFDNRREIDTACLPARYGVAYRNLEEAAEPNDAVLPVFSPATICPAGYTSACSFNGQTTTGTAPPSDETPVTGDMFGFTMSRILGSEQAAVGCCQSGYVCDTKRAYHCTSDPAPGDVLTADENSLCSSHTENIKAFTVAAKASIYADGPCVMLVRDVASTTSSSSAPTASTAPSTSTNAQAGSSNHQVSQDTEKDRLSTGAKAAIGVCVPLIIVAAGVALCMLLRRRSQRRANAENLANTSGDYPTAVPNTTGNSDGLEGKSEMDATEYRQSSVMTPGSDRVVSMLSDGTSATSQGGAANRATLEMCGSLPFQPRLHEDIMELPAERAAQP